MALIKPWSQRMPWRLPRWAFLLAYLVLIGLFAVLFATFRADFYHSTVTLEPSLALERSNLAEELWTVLIDSTRSAHVLVGADSARVSGWMTFSELKATEDGSLRFTADLPVLISNARGTFWAGAHFEIQVLQAGLPPSDLGRRKDDSSTLCCLMLDIQQRGGPPIPAAVMEYLLRPRASVEGFYCVPMRLARGLSAFSSANRGRPGEMGFFSALPRMLYLSVVTINTLGYGDILPLTSRARLLTGLESTLGIILLGIFVSSIATRAGAGRNAENNEPEVNE